MWRKGAKLWCALAVALLAASPVAAVDGDAVYKEKCAKCHGETGKGDTPTGKAMKVPSMVGDAKLLAASAAELEQGIRENKKHKEPVKKTHRRRTRRARTGCQTPRRREVRTGALQEPAESVLVLAPVLARQGLTNR